MLFTQSGSEYLEWMNLNQFSVNIWVMPPIHLIFHSISIHKIFSSSLWLRKNVTKLGSLKQQIIFQLIYFDIFLLKSEYFMKTFHNSNNVNYNLSLDTL